MDKASTNILWLDQITNDDVALVGGKNASLGEMYQQLVPKGINIPNAFVITAKAYREFVEEAGLLNLVRSELSDLDTHDVKALQQAGKKVRSAFVKAPIPEGLAQEIREAYGNLSNAYGVVNVDVAVRSSATAEDLPGASFAGQQETYLNVSGVDDVIDATRKAFASLFTDRAISYRVDKGFNHFDVSLSVGVQKMVRSDKGSSGVMFTLDTETGFRDVVQISSSWGLGEMVVQGKVTPDEFLVFKPALAAGRSAVIKKELGPKRTKMVYSKTKKSPTKVVGVTTKDQGRFTLTDEEILTLARWGVIIEKHYTARAGRDRPMDMEWARDGQSGELFIVQARPETVHAEKKDFSITEYTLKDKPQPLVEGIAVGRKIVTGKAHVILSTKKLDTFKDGEILVTEITDPDWEPIMKKAVAIITEKGGRTSHAAIVSRELGIPAVIGAPGALKKIKTGQQITIDTSSGMSGSIYSGVLSWNEETHDLGNIPTVKTSICMNIGTPEGAFAYSFLPHKGVGLARLEFIFASHIRVHPLALLNFKKLKDVKLKAAIEKLTRGYKDKTTFFIDKLAQGVAQIGAAFYPHQVIVRFSDFKTNEYRALLGGQYYEPEEANPMLGWRGASRYTHPEYKEAFKLECSGIKKAREEMGISNIAVMVPFCRTPEEGKSVLDVMQEAGLARGDNDLKVYAMCEIPTNVIRANEFLDVFDGFSIGSNDLTQLTLGMDRDSERVSSISNENDPAVREMVHQAIMVCKKRGKYIGFCGQAPSDFPEFTKFLVEEGIDAISLNPDSIIPMMFKISEAEGT